MIVIAFILLSLLPVSPGITCTQSPQAKIERKATEPGEFHEKLDVLCGLWDVAITFSIGGREFKGTASCEAQWVLAGRFLQQEYKTTRGGKPFSVLQYVGYDNHKKKTFEIKMESSDTSVMHTEGGFSEDGKVITNVGERTDPMTGKVARLRTVTTIVDKTRFIVEWFQATDDGKEEKVVTMVHTRRVE